LPYIFQTTYIQYIPLDGRKIKVCFFLQICFYRSSFQFLAYPSQGVAGAASESPLEGVENNEMRTRGQIDKASIATNRLRAGIIEPSSWDFSPMLFPSIYKKDCIAAVL
jgi:hypothetical protein